MRRLALPFLAVSLLLALPLPGDGAEGDRVFEGEYRSGDGDGPLRARFTPVGEARWTVTFDFIFNDRQRTYTGTAEGNLSQGRLSGRVKDEYGRRTFTFRGEFDAGVFHGTHAEVYRGSEERTGTLTLEE